MTRNPELIYVVEDELDVARLIRAALEKFGFRTEVFRTAEAFFHGVRHRVPDLVILDLGLPDMDGMAVLQQLRSKHTCGLLVLTGRGDVYDRVMGLELGADDYVVKPYEPREMIARVRSILRRYPRQPVVPADPTQRVAEFAGWRFEPGSNTLTSPGGQSETLSTAEAISVVNGGLALAGHFGDGRLHASDLAAGLHGAIVRDPVQDRVIWLEYLETVVKERQGWKDLYRACREVAG